ncbi:MAG: hypothetical protein C0600_14110 [Ignavibacteria bacterium]|nr:MAG: hypothetical protein C0600_14110 [Ignavibacteria bacterium]
MRVAIVVLMLCFSAELTAQVSVSLYTSSMYDDNSFAFYEKREDVYHALFGAVSAGFSGEHSYHQGYYYGALVLFRTYADRTYNIHTLGSYSQFQLNYRNDGSESAAAMSHELYAHQSGPSPPPADVAIEQEVFSDSLVSYLFVIPQVGMRLDHDNWDFYDFNRGSLLLRLRRHVAGDLMSRLYYTIQYKQYPNLEQFTHVEHYAGALFSHALGSGWELFGSADGGFKSYTASMSDTLWVSDGKPGKGKGGIKPPVAVISQFSTPSTAQFVFSGGLSYRLFARAPLSLSYVRRSNPSTDARYVREDAIFGLSEDEIFDDRYGYQADELRLQMDGTLPGNIRTTNVLAFLQKDYPRTATDLNGVARPGAPQRVDNRVELRLQALYPFFRNSAGKGLSVGLAYNYIRNRSNNAYHDYNINQVALVLSGDW